MTSHITFVFRFSLYVCKHGSNTRIRDSICPSAKLSVNSSKVGAVVKPQRLSLCANRRSNKQSAVSVRLTRRKDFRENWRGWLRHYTKGDVLSPILCGMQGIFHVLNTSGL